MKAYSEPTHTYEANGLRFRSDFPLPCERVEGGQEVVLSIVRQHGTWHENTPQTHKAYLHKGQLILHYEALATFVFESHSKISVYAQAPDDLVAQYIMGSVFAAYLYLCDFTVLHASALDFEGCCVLILGDSGAGKSTLTHFLIGEGARFINDDLVALKKNDKRITIQAGFGVRKIPSSLVDKLLNPKPVPYLDSSKKHYVQMKQDTSKSSFMPSRVIIMEVSDGLDLRCSNEKGALVVKSFFDHLFMASMCQLLKKEKMVFDHLSMLAKQVKVLTVHRPNKSDTINEVLESAIAFIKET